ncbi:MAG: GNAT family N-acetyltransferase [Candidatus Levyibacteriota bacterium]
MMDHFDFLQKYMDLQYGVVFDKFFNLGFARIGYCETDKTTFCNYTSTNQMLSQNQLEQLEQKMIALNRQPAVYFENKKQFKPFITFLLKNDYEKDYEDSWMFYQNKKIDANFFNQVKKVEGKNDLKIFLAIFDKCFQANDPQNPYGNLGDYLKVAKKSWHRHHKTDRLEYFIAYKDDKPVATSSLSNYGGIGYISNIGSLPEVRGEGFGKLMTLYSIYISQQHGNSAHCLSTEEKSYPNEFYKRIGFQTDFTALCYKKTPA